jgi:hypothetical protein
MHVFIGYENVFGAEFPLVLLAAVARGDENMLTDSHTDVPASSVGQMPLKEQRAEMGNLLAHRADGRVRLDFFLFDVHENSLLLDEVEIPIINLL